MTELSNLPFDQWSAGQEEEQSAQKEESGVERAASDMENGGENGAKECTVKEDLTQDPAEGEGAEAIEASAEPGEEDQEPGELDESEEPAELDESEESEDLEEELGEAEGSLEEEDSREEGEGRVYFNDLPADTEVIGVRFRSSGKVYYFDPKGIFYPEGSHAVVETARGQEYGTVAQSNHVVSGREIVLPLRCALRVATEEDRAHNEENLRKAEEAFYIGNKKIVEHGLEMKLIDTEYTFDNSKLLFYFTSDGRVDFRDLVKDLAAIFRCRIELRQMGIRDEAKVLGGLGTCGRPFCCHAFLPDFVQVSIKMAKEQNLSLNAAKISGACGRLMCCLRYEYDTYLEEGRLTPKVDSLVNTPDGIGVVVEAKPLLGLVKVRPLEDAAVAPKVYAREDLTPIKKGDENYERALEEKQLDKAARAAGTTRAALKSGKADKGEREEKPDRPQRPAPKRASSYTGQVLPEILKRSEKPEEGQQSLSFEEKQALGEGQKKSHGQKKHHQRKQRDRRQDKGERQGEKEDRREQNKDASPARYEKSPRGEKRAESTEKGEGSFESRGDRGTRQKERPPRYEKSSRQDLQSSGAKPLSGSGQESEGQKTEGAKKKNRPFRRRRDEGSSDKK